MGRQLFTFLNQKRVLICLVIIYCVGLWLRLHHLDKALWALPAYDDSRDFLVAKHMVEYHQFLRRGPLVAGGFGWLLNSPVYYYFQSLLWFLTRSVATMMTLWAVLMSSIIPLAYWAGKKTVNRTTGLVFALITAVHPLFITYSQEIFQPFVMPILMLVVYLTLLKLAKENTLKNILLFILAVSIPVHFHYGILLLAPALVFWLVKKWYALINDDFTLQNTLWPLVASLAGFLTWVSFTFHTYFFDQAFFFIFNFEDLAKKDSSYLTRFSEIGRQILETMFPVWPDVTRWILVATLVILLGWSGRKLNRQVMAILGSLAGSIVLIPLFGAGFNFYYLSAIMPFFFLLIAVAFGFAFTKSKLAGLCLLLPFLLIWKDDLMNWYAKYPPVSVYEESKLVSQKIAEDLGPEPRNFALAQLETSNFHIYDYWATSAYWFHLENIYNQPLVVLTDRGVNHMSVVGSAQKMYLICDHRTDVELIAKRCTYRFESNRTYLELPGKELYHSDRYTVWKYDFKPEASESYLLPNLVYEDFFDY